MAYIGKVELKENWEKLSDLIKAQVAGQSAFAFDSAKTYSMMTDTANDTCEIGMYWCVSATKPTALNDGEFLDPGVQGIYQPESGADLWVKIRGSKHEVRLAISEK